MNIYRFRPPFNDPAGQGECRRFDAISNMTIAVACPD
jgi:hypothetical protein